MIKTIFNALRIPTIARSEMWRDRTYGRTSPEPSAEACIAACTAWLERAQDFSASRDGGVARHFSFIDGWSSSYPETTGYIIPTLLELSRRHGDTGMRVRAQRMLDWLVSIQFPTGAFQGGLIDSLPCVPVVFNTGQILLGLAAGCTEFSSVYHAPATRAADWLVSVQDPDGAWRHSNTPFAVRGEKAYKAHVAWGLFEAAAALGREDWSQAACANTSWALGKQQPNGWVEDCCLLDRAKPLTHTLGYFLRGILEAYKHTGEERFLNGALRTARGLAGAVAADGRLPGKLDHNFKAAAPWVCLTGSVQIAASCLELARIASDDTLAEIGLRLNRYVRSTIQIEGDPNVVGGVKGSYPVDGDYGQFMFLNWAAKFAIDSFLTELDGRSV